MLNAFADIENPEEARELLEKLRKSGALDPEGTFRLAEANWEVFGKEGVQELLQEWARSDPEEAAAWAGSLDSSELRDESFRKVYGHWLKSDPGAAQAHLESQEALSVEVLELIEQDFEASLKGDPSLGG